MLQPEAAAERRAARGGEQPQCQARLGPAATTSRPASRRPAATAALGSVGTAADWRDLPHQQEADVIDGAVSASRRRRRRQRREHHRLHVAGSAVDRWSGAHHFPSATRPRQRPPFRHTSLSDARTPPLAAGAPARPHPARAAALAKAARGARRWQRLYLRPAARGAAQDTEETGVVYACVDDARPASEGER